jgi:hypothetical protein
MSRSIEPAYQITPAKLQHFPFDGLGTGRIHSDRRMFLDQLTEVAMNTRIEAPNTAARLIQ